MEQINPKLFNWASVLEASTLEQAVQTSTMPFIFPHVALMPDAHLGLGSTVGSVIPTKGAIMPAAVGVDIGCGMQAVRIGVKREDFIPFLLPLREEIERAVPMGLGPSGTNKRFEEGSSADKRIQYLWEIARDMYTQYAENWEYQIGSLGSGNHFIEFSFDEEEYIWATLHSGSRSVGKNIADHHIKLAEKLCEQWFVNLPHKDLSFFPQGTEEFQNYIRDLNWAQEYARMNRDEMMDRVLEAVDRVFDGAIRYSQGRFDCHHNYSTMEHHWNTDVWVTRKGAVRARPGDVALIPGSMGTPSYVVKGKGNKLSFDSAPHGAGRAMGRKEAFRRISLEEAQAAMEGILWGNDKKLIDESPGAYKDITRVIQDAGELIEIQHVLTPIMNIKGV